MRPLELTQDSEDDILADGVANPVVRGAGVAARVAAGDVLQGEDRTVSTATVLLYTPTPHRKILVW